MPRLKSFHLLRLGAGAQPKTDQDCCVLASSRFAPLVAGCIGLEAAVARGRDEERDWEFVGLIVVVDDERTGFGWNKELEVEREYLELGKLRFYYYMIAKLLKWSLEGGDFRTADHFEPDCSRYHC